MEEGKLASISLQKFTELEELAEEIMGDKHQVSWHLDKLQNTPQLFCISWNKNKLDCIPTRSSENAA